MRRKDKEITNSPDLEVILQKAKVCRLGLLDGDLPYIVPINYGYNTGEIFIHAAKEGKKNITPYWRTLKQGGVINEKYPGGVKIQKELLEKEGHNIKQKGKKYVVENFEKYLAKM